MLITLSSNGQALLAGSPVTVPGMESFKARMRRIRQRAGYTSQANAADEIGCERGTVSMWEAPSSNVKTVSAEWLFEVARVYKVRPDWINNLRSSDDGFPWEPNSASMPPVEPPPSVTDGPLSHRATLDPAILHEAITLLLFDLDHGGPRSARSASDLVLDLYRRLQANGGRLPPDEEIAFEESARARGQHRGRVDGSDEGGSGDQRRGGTRR